MNTSDCGDLLRACAFYDNRKVTREAAIAWEHSIHADISKADALKAIAEHHAESTEYIGPAHVNQRVKAIRRERLQRAGDPPMPGRLTWQQEREWRQNWCDGVKAGMDRDLAAVHASQAMSLPPELPAVDRTQALRALLGQQHPADTQAARP
jgi:hypothetical protein